MAPLCVCHAPLALQYQKLFKFCLRPVTWGVLSFFNMLIRFLNKWCQGDNESDVMSSFVPKAHKVLWRLIKDTMATHSYIL